MKPIAIKIYLVQIFLIVLASSFAFLSIGVPEYDIAFWSASWGSIVHGEIKISLLLGVIPFSNLSLYLCFIFLYLLFEFYGLKTAVYTSLAVGLVLLLQFYLFFGLQKLNPVGFDHHILLSNVPLSNLDQKLMHALAAAVSCGFASIFVLAWILKKLTKDYFMFLRFFFSSVIGFCVFAFVKVYLQKMQDLALISIIMETITPALQFAGLSLLSIIPLYILRLILGFFRGQGISNDDNIITTTGNPLFKAAKTLPPKVQEEPPAEPSQEEITHA